MTRSNAAIAALVALSAVLTACTSGGSSPTPIRPTPTTTPSPTVSPTPSPTPSPSATPAPSTTEVTSAAQAAALVLASNPLFGNLQPLLPDLIGQSASYEASEVADGYQVTVTMGWGDCESGCIDRHTWNYRVDRAGAIELVGEEGPPPEAVVPVGGAGPARVTIRLLAGPTCPVEQVPADPNCAARAVTNAEVVVRDPSGKEIARALSDAAGAVVVQVPAGAYFVEAPVVEGLMGQAEAQAFSVVGGSSADIVLAYDTGIR